MENIPITKDSIPERQCNVCKQFFPETKEYFVTGKKHKNGLRSLCKECRRLTRKDRKNPPIPKGMKRCSRCKVVHPATTEFFTVRRRAKDGLSEYCKTCRKQQYQEGLQRNVERPASLVCRGCNKEFPFTEEFFYKNGRNKYGFFTICKTCHAEQGKNNRIPYRERRNALRRQRWLQDMEYRAKTRQRTKKSHDKHRDRLRAYGRQRRITYPEKVRAIQYRYNHSEQGMLRNRAYCRTRYARKKDVGGRYTAQDIQRQYARQKGKCYWCKKKLTKYHVDHVIPITREGSSNDPWNLVLSCPPCNESRGNKLPHEWEGHGRLL